VPPGRPSSEEVRRHLEAVLASRSFASSERLQRFLRFVVGRALDGDEREIKEYSIGVEVYDRGADFDPKADALVRTEAFRLRSKLKAYYDNEGAASPVRIELPKGSYVPRFTAAADQSLEEASIAVLPFASFDKDVEREHFADGLTEEIIHTLAGLGGLRVVARTTVFQFKGRPADVREIGERLKVRTVLEGSVRRTADGVRVTAQLIDAADGCHVWSKTFDRSVADAVRAQEDVAREVADSLRLRFAASMGTLRPRRHTGNEEALRLYLRSRYLFRQWSPDSFQLGLGCLEQAVALDPGYAAAHAAVAEMLGLALYFGLAPPAAIDARLRQAAGSALALDPTSPEAHIALGTVSAAMERGWSAAERHFQRALEHAPGNVTAHSWYAYTVLLPLGRFDEADEHMERALALDPLDPVTVLSVANLLFWAGDYDTSFARYRDALELDPNFAQTRWNLAYTEEFAGRAGEALADYRRAVALFGEAAPPRLLADLARLLAKDGAREEALAIRDRLDKAGPSVYVPPSARAWIELGLGDTDAALAWLERAEQQRDLFAIWLTVDPRYGDIRDQPRLAALIERMHLGDRSSWADGGR
jgi:serine/threonine-protein kinase